MEQILSNVTHLLIVREGNLGKGWGLRGTATNSAEAREKKRLFRAQGLDVIVTQIIERSEVEYDPR